LSLPSDELNNPAERRASRHGDEPVLDFTTARERLLEYAKPCEARDILPLFDALGRVLAVSAHAPCDIPPNPNSALDGYAIATRDLALQGETCLRVSQRIAAGGGGRVATPR
jgi:molybdopterin molybdotransferase